MAGQDIRFQFGENWKDFSKTVDDKALEAAMNDLSCLLPDSFDPTGKTFLDIGSGSGLHSVAASRLGFKAVAATDYDIDSVEATKANALRFGAGIEVSRDDILNTRIEGAFDVVYSWGVLHHTGDMAVAVQKAASVVAPGGTFILAIYVKTPFCGMWKVVKRMYSSGGRVRQKAMQGAYISLLKARTAGRSGNLVRGMDFRHDAIDWLGGYPYESATPEEVAHMVGSGFRLVKSTNTASGLGLFGTGCAEYVYTRAP